MSLPYETIQLSDVTDKSRVTDVTVAGSSQARKIRMPSGLHPSCVLYDNIVLPYLATASYLLYGTENEINIQFLGIFYVNDLR